MYLAQYMYGVSNTTNDAAICWGMISTLKMGAEHYVQTGTLSNA